MRAIAVAGVFVAFAISSGCSSSTGILPVGPDAYTISEKFSPFQGGSDAAERAALTKANEFCAQQNRQFLLSMMGQTGVVTQYGSTGFSVTFRCLAYDDPALSRFQVGPAPNTIIEQRNR